MVKGEEIQTQLASRKLVLNFLSLFLCAPLFSAPIPPSDYAENLKKEEAALALDPLNLNLLSQVSDLRLLTSGHTASRQLLMQFLQNGRFVMNPELVTRAEQKLISSLHRFRLEEAQSLYLRGEVQKKNGDYTAALTMFTQALRIEPENLVILKDKCLTEFDLDLFPAYYQSLHTISSLIPFEKEWRLSLLEAHVKFKAYAKITDLLASTPYGRSTREDLALATAYLEMGEADLAMPLLRGLSSRARDTSQFFLVQFNLGKAYSQLEHPNLAKLHLLRAQRLSRQLPLRRWDPYDLSEKAKETAQWLEKLDTEMKRANPSS